MTRDTPPRIDLRLLRQFVAVAEELHFRRAAERIGMSQPPLTAALRRLEADVGATLIERNRRTVRLTAAGAVLLDEARRLLRAADQALTATRDAAAGRRGRVRLGHVGSAMYGRLPEAIRRVRRQDPELRIELREMTTAALVTALQAGDLDLGLCIPPLAWPSRRAEPQCGLGRIPAAYAAANTAAIGIVNVLALEGRAHGITVNAISPVARTRMWGVQDDPDDLRPEAVASGALHLVSADCTASGWVLRAANGQFVATQAREALGVQYPRDLAAVRADTPDAVAAAWHRIALGAPEPRGAPGQAPATPPAARCP